MKFESSSFEKEPSFVVAPPPIDALLQVNGEDSYLPTEIINSEERIKQAELRLKALKAIQSIPKTKSESCTENVPEELYTSLTELFNSDPQNNRLALYLPFEWMPSIDQIKNEPGGATTPAEQFLSAYKTAWFSLLSSSEFRADYADGDIPEPEFRNEKLPKVVKAAHLIPNLLEKGILTIDEAIVLFETAEDPTLLNSIADGLYVAREKGLITDEQLANMKDSESTFVSNTARLIEIEVKTFSNSPKEHPDFQLAVSMYKDEIKNNQEEIVNTPMTEARRIWLQSDKDGKTIEKYAAMISDRSSVDALLSSNEISDTALGIRSVEYTIRHNESLAEEYVQVLQNFLTHEEKSLRDTAQKTLYHLHSMGLISDESLQSYGLELPQLNTSSESVLNGMKSETQQLTEAAERIKNNEILSRYIYPAVIFLGSRMKGYASETADFDVAVFIKPSTPLSERQVIQEQLADVFANTKADAGAMEFWLEEKSDGNYTVKNFDTLDEKLGDQTLVHPLLGAWCGDESAIVELQSKLIPQYLYTTDAKINGVDARSIWLNEIEHTTLKYRLMHKGYSRFSASQLETPTEHSYLIDNASAFHDHGYRRLATELFLKKVFLPQLSK